MLTCQHLISSAWHGDTQVARHGSLLGDRGLARRLATAAVGAAKQPFCFRLVCTRSLCRTRQQTRQQGQHYICARCTSQASVNACSRLNILNIAPRAVEWTLISCRYNRGKVTSVMATGTSSLPILVASIVDSAWQCDAFRLDKRASVEIWETWRDKWRKIRGVRRCNHSFQVSSVRPQSPTSSKERAATHLKEHAEGEKRGPRCT